MKKTLLAINWYAVSAVLFIFAMFGTLLNAGVPDFYAIPLGLTAITAAVLSLAWPKG